MGVFSFPRVIVVPLPKACPDLGFFITWGINAEYMGVFSFPRLIVVPLPKACPDLGFLVLRSEGFWFLNNPISRLREIEPVVRLMVYERKRKG